MNKSLISLLVLLGAATIALYSAQPQQKMVGSFAEFKAEFGKFYADAKEQEYRKTVFLRNLVKIEQHNADKSNTHQLGVNQFADLTQEQFVAIYLNTKVNTKYTEGQVFARTLKDVQVLGDVDWTAQGKVSQVKNQGQCGSCWAFSAIASMQSAFLLKGQTSLFSEQQLVDCSRAYGNFGCNGGWMDSAFQYIVDHGITTGSAYPYVARDQACAIDGGSWKISSFTDVPGCDNLANALNGRPVSVAVDASNWSLYKGGVLSSCGTAVNHGVLLVGASNDFWKIKNSWGSTWGQTGFIRLARGNTCAVCSYPSYPSV